jgi:hypothetical protein
MLIFTDANKIVSSLPILHSDYSAPDEHIVFLRKFFRSHDTQTLMKVPCCSFLGNVNKPKFKQTVKTYANKYYEKKT